MGKDDIHKRRAKNQNKLKRNLGSRKTFKRILIVCEGSKTEPYYFRGLINFYKIRSADVVVDGSSGSAPSSVFNYAKKQYALEKRKGNPFDEVYCVFDKDSHPCYERTVDEIKRSRPIGVFKACVSVPCFEVWLTLHYGYSDKPYYTTGNKSVGDLALQDLKKKCPLYEKGMVSFFEDHEKNLDDAIRNSKKLLDSNRATNTDNPSTCVHELVEALKDLRKP